MSNEYKKTCHDELNWIEVEQLHTATVAISKNCFEYKKLCIGLLGVGAALIIKFATEPFTNINFCIALLMCSAFWLADSTAFYYQRSLRTLMNNKMKDIATRNEIKNYSTKEITASRIHSLFNESMILYYVLITALLVSWWVLTCK